jgi:hypothetical protein
MASATIQAPGVQRSLDSAHRHNKPVSIHGIQGLPCQHGGASHEHHQGLEGDGPQNIRRREGSALTLDVVTQIPGWKQIVEAQLHGGQDSLNIAAAKAVHQHSAVIQLPNSQ